MTHLVTLIKNSQQKNNKTKRQPKATITENQTKKKTAKNKNYELTQKPTIKENSFTRKQNQPSKQM